MGHGRPYCSIGDVVTTKSFATKLQSVRTCSDGEVQDGYDDPFFELDGVKANACSGSLL